LIFCPSAVTGKSSGPNGFLEVDKGLPPVFSQETDDGADVNGSHSTSLPFSARPHRSKRSFSVWAVIAAIERCLKFLRCPEVLKVLRVRAISGLLLEEVVNSPSNQLQMLHSAARQRSGFAKSPDGVGAEVIEGVRHGLGKRPFAPIVRSTSSARRTGMGDIWRAPIIVSRPQLSAWREQ